MVGNSLRSDVLPVLEIGGYACHVPFHTTWAHEMVEPNVEHENMSEIANITELVPLLLPKSA
jgi:putative hydrolase of the HAD superfamily